MTISYYSTKSEADAQGGETSWCIVKDGKPWRVATGPDVAPQFVDTDREAVKAYAKLVALKSMTPSQISAWVDGNVTNLAQAQDAIKTLAIAVGYLIRAAI